jgi:hypothetical protein
MEALMPTVTLGNVSVVQGFKPDEGINVVVLRRVKNVGNQETTFQLNEVDGQDRPSRAMNLALLVRMWQEHSDKDPAWVDGNDRLTVELVADHFDCPIGRPDNWRRGT